MIATNLNRLVKHTKPLEVRVIGPALKAARTALSEKEYKTIFDHINYLKKSNYKMFTKMDDETRERLVQEANIYF